MDFIIRLAEEFFKKHKRLARYRRIFAFLAAVVVFATTYELILPAITMDRQRACRRHGWRGLLRGGIPGGRGLLRGQC